MPFSALLEGQRVDLVGENADAVWARANIVKHEGQVRCKGCGGELRLREGAGIARHFFHRRKPDVCILSGPAESPEHLRAKTAVAAAVRASGGDAEIEWIGPDRTFVADVLGTWRRDDGTTNQVNFEVQRSAQTADRTIERNEVRQRAIDLTVWVLLAPEGKGADNESGQEEASARPGWAHWADGVPSIRLASGNTHARWWAERLNGTSPQWRETTLSTLVKAIGEGAVFLPASHPWQRSGWVLQTLAEEWQAALERQRQREFREQQARERHRQNRGALEARQQADRDALRERLVRSGHRPRITAGGPLYGHALLVVAGDVTYAVLPVAKQVWSGACRANLRATTVVANSSEDRRRLKATGVKAVPVDQAALPDRSSWRQGHRPVEKLQPEKRHEGSTPSAGPVHNPAVPRKVRRELRQRQLAEEAADAKAKRTRADAKRREEHIRRVGERIGMTVGPVSEEEGWIAARVNDVYVITGNADSTPPPSWQPDCIVWCDSSHQATQLGARGWKTITSLSELLS